MTVPAFTTTSKVPLPPKSYSARIGSQKWPLGTMKVNDSFTIPLPKDARTSSRSTAASYICRYAKKHGLKFITRLEDAGRTLRVWRTA